MGTQSTPSIEDLYQTARTRYLRVSANAGQSRRYDKWQVKHSKDCWGPDWSKPSRHSLAHVEFAIHLAEDLPPDAVAVLNTPVPLKQPEFLRRLEAWRLASEGLHSGPCPRRGSRKLEYIAALEDGFNPRRAAEGRLHAHVLLYNLHRIKLCELASKWRALNNIKDLSEPLIRPYSGDCRELLYVLKTMGTDADMIRISRKLTIKTPTRQERRRVDAGTARNEVRSTEQGVLPPERCY